MPAIEPQTLLDRLGAQALECRRLVRAMHEAQQDLIGDIREGQRVGAQLKVLIKSTIETDVSDLIEKEVREHIEALTRSTNRAIDLAAKKINAEFCSLSDPLIKSFEEMVASAELLHSRIDRLEGKVDAQDH
jgi:hypothetical protein